MDTFLDWLSGAKMIMASDSFFRKPIILYTFIAFDCYNKQYTAYDITSDISK